MQCLKCNGWSRKAVAECADNCCPLWLYRPTKEESDDEDQLNDLDRAESEQQKGE